MSESAEQVENNIAQDDNITLSMVVTSMYNQWNLDRAVKAATVPMVLLGTYKSFSSQENRQRRDERCWEAKQLTILSVELNQVAGNLLLQFIIVIILYPSL